MNYTVNYPDKNKQKGHPILVMTKRVHAAWASEDYPNVEIVRVKYEFHESFLKNYINYMWERKFVPDWNYLYKNLSLDELRIFEKLYLNKQKREKFVRDWERPDLTKQQVKWIGSLGVKDWKNHLAYHTKYGNSIN